MGDVNNGELDFDIEKSYKGDKVVLYLKGKIDTQTSPELQDYLEEYFSDEEEVQDLILDFSDIDYLSSAGLRVILYAQKKIKSINEEYNVNVINVNNSVMEVFDMTGFTDIINISQK